MFKSLKYIRFVSGWFQESVIQYEIDRKHGKTIIVTKKTLLDETLSHFAAISGTKRVWWSEGGVSNGQ